MLISKICITGGPCAGKTTLLNYFKEKIKDEDIEVLEVNEKATELINEKYDPFNCSVFNAEAIKREIIDEFSKEQIAIKSSKKYVIITDRGIMDNARLCWNGCSIKDFEEV